VSVQKPVQRQAPVADPTVLLSDTVEIADAAFAGDSAVGANDDDLDESADDLSSEWIQIVDDQPQIPKLHAAGTS
jgi:hypothetical protein